MLACVSKMSRDNNHATGCARANVRRWKKTENQILLLPALYRSILCIHRWRREFLKSFQSHANNFWRFSRIRLTKQPKLLCVSWLHCFENKMLDCEKNIYRKNRVCSKQRPDSIVWLFVYAVVPHSHAKLLKWKKYWVNWQVSHYLSAEQHCTHNHTSYWFKMSLSMFHSRNYWRERNNKMRKQIRLVIIHRSRMDEIVRKSRGTWNWIEFWQMTTIRQRSMICRRLAMEDAIEDAIQMSSLTMRWKPFIPYWHTYIQYIWWASLITNVLSLLGKPLLAQTLDRVTPIEDILDRVTDCYHFD